MDLNIGQRNDIAQLLREYGIIFVNTFNTNKYDETINNFIKELERKI